MACDSLLYAAILELQDASLLSAGCSYRWQGSTIFLHGKRAARATHPTGDGKIKLDNAFPLSIAAEQLAEVADFEAAPAYFDAFLAFLARAGLQLEVAECAEKAVDAERLSWKPYAPESLESNTTTE